MQLYARFKIPAKFGVLLGGKVCLQWAEGSVEVLVAGSLAVERMEPLGGGAALGPDEIFSKSSLVSKTGMSYEA